jgi:tol-pal system protein YbgF
MTTHPLKIAVRWHTHHMIKALVVLMLMISSSLPLLAQDAAELLVRVNRLENQMRTLSGQLEQAQFENRRLQDQLKRFQEDVEFRFQDMKGGKAGNVRPQPAAPQPQANPTPQRRSDAFDPSTNISGGDIGNLAAQLPSSPLNITGDFTDESSFDEPMDFGTPPTSRNPLSGRGDGTLSPSGLPANGSAQNFSQSRATPPTPQVMIAAPATDARTQYEIAYAYLLQKQYDAAEESFRQFLRSHPRHTLSADAMFWLGDTYSQRNKHREAAEQFLKVTTDYPQSAKAPDATLKLGMSLNALGAKDQACATFAKAERDYASRGDTFKRRVDQEQKRINCA